MNDNMTHCSNCGERAEMDPCSEQCDAELELAENDYTADLMYEETF